jgi:LacI family transcriptional regulator
MPSDASVNAGRRVTLREVAAEAGVSVGTASYALNDNPLTRPETRARVLAAARRLNYSPDRTAHPLRDGRTSCLAIVYTGRHPTTVEAIFYTLVIRGIVEVLEDQGYTIRLVQLSERALSEMPEHIRLSLSPQHVDGLLVLNWQEPTLMERLSRLGVPIVAVDASGAYRQGYAVDSDDRGGVSSGVNY